MLFFIISFHEAEFYLCFLITSMNMSFGEAGTGNSSRVLFSSDHLDIFLDLKSLSS